MKKIGGSIFALLLLLSSAKAEASELVGNISVGLRPTDIVVTPDGKKLYVTNMESDSVSVIDSETATVVKNISLTSNGRPHYIEIHPSGNEVYIAERLTGKIKIISTATDTVIGSINTLSSLINDAVVTPNGERLYVLSAIVRGTIKVTIIDLATRSVIGSITTADAQDRIAFSPDGTMGYMQLVVNNSNPLKIYTQVIDLGTNQVLGVIQDTAVSVFSDDGKIGWGGHAGSNYISKIDIDNRTIIASTSVAARPSTVIRDRFGRVYVTNDTVGKVSILDAETLSIIETVNTTASNPAGMTLNKDQTLLYVANGNVIDIIQLDKVEQDKDIYELLRELVDAIEKYGFSTEIQNSYMANLKKVETFLNNSKYIPSENQLRALIKKLEQDRKSNFITDGQYNDLLDKASKILSLVPQDAFGTVPLMTQIISPYPSIASTTTWADATYAGGRANRSGDCGLTIRQCGCAITSLTMIGRYYGVERGFDGSNVDPLNMDKWLLNNTQNEGYDSVGNIMWPWGLAYLGESKDGKYMSKLSINKANVTSDALIRESVEKGAPALAYNAQKGHFFVLTGVLDFGGYSVRDPLWYNTKTTDDTRNAAGRVQDYDNVVTKANLLSYSENLKPVQELIHISLASPAELLVTDQKGRRLGYDPNTKSYVSEIPGGTYGRQFISREGEPGADPHRIKEIALVEPEGELFDVQVIGTDSGTYTLTTAVSDGDGGVFGTNFSSSTRNGAVDSYLITTLMNEDNVPMSLERILSLVPLKEQKKFIQAFKVINAQYAKDHTLVMRTLIENLIKYIEQQYSGVSWARPVIAALKNVI